MCRRNMAHVGCAVPQSSNQFALCKCGPEINAMSCYPVYMETVS